MKYDFKYNVYVSKNKSQIMKSYLNKQFAFAFVDELEKINKMLDLGLSIQIATFPIEQKDLIPRYTKIDKRLM